MIPHNLNQHGCFPNTRGQKRVLFRGFLCTGFVSSPAQPWEHGWVTTQPCSQPTSLLTFQLLPLLDSPGPISEGTPLPLQKQTRAIFTASVTTKARAVVSDLSQIPRLCNDVAWYKVFFGESCIKSYL